MADSPVTVERISPGCFHVAPHGSLAVDTAPDFDERVRELEDANAATIVVDLRDVSFMDSTGLGRLLALVRRGRQAGERVCFVRGPRNVQRVFVLTGLSDRLDWVTRPEDAGGGVAPARP
jgi:anti-sigma B factor antagonist